MDVELLRVGDVELLEPPAQSLPSAVVVERSGDVLRVEPFQSACGNVSAVLGAIGTFFEVPFSVDLELRSGP